jgi:uncharacterized membrane protein YdjX (TVP38/TMEM64 family)
MREERRDTMGTESPDGTTALAGDGGGAAAANDPVRRFLTHVDVTALIPFVLIGILVVLLIVLVGRDLRHHVDTLESWIAASGDWGLVTFMGTFILLTSVLVPGAILCIIAGALFGLGQGTAVVVAASFVAAALQYGLSRGLLKNRVQRVVAARPSLAAIQRAALRDGLKLQALLRMTPVNPVYVSYAMGAAGVRFRGFMLALLALVPNLFLEVYFGYAGKNAAGMAGRSMGEVVTHDLALFVGLVAFAVVMVRISRMAKRSIIEAAAAQ